MGKAIFKLANVVGVVLLVNAVLAVNVENSMSEDSSKDDSGINGQNFRTEVSGARQMIENYEVEVLSFTDEAVIFDEKKNISIKKKDKSLDLSFMDLKEIPASLLFETDQLQELNLEGNNRIEFPEDFGVLRDSLKKLILRNCNITFEQLEYLANAFNALEYLDLSQNPNIHPFPDNFGQGFKTLRILKLDECNLSFEEIESMRFDNIEELSIAFNNLTDMPADYNFDNFYLAADSNARRLVKLNVSACQMTYNGLLALTKMRLTHLKASFNSFYKPELENPNTGYMEAIRPYLPKKFTYASIKNWISDVKKHWRTAVHHGVKYAAARHLAKNFIHLSLLKPSVIDEDFDMGELNSSLVTLELEYCSLYKKQLKIILGKVQKLKVLNVQGNHFEDFDEHFDFLGAKDTLSELNVGFCNLTAYSLKALGNLNGLTVLIADTNYLTGSVDCKWECLSGALVELDLSFTGISSDDLACISTNFPVMRKLDISHNTFKEDVKLDPEWKKSLKKLTLVDTTMSQKVFDEFLKLEALRYLNANNTESAKLLSESMVDLTKLSKSLRILKLSGSVELKPFLFNLHLFKLRKLCLNYVNITNLGRYNKSEEMSQMNPIGNMKSSLKTLELTECTVDRCFIEQISQFTGLEKLILESTNFTERTSFKVFQKEAFKNIKTFKSLICIADPEFIDFFVRKKGCSSRITKNYMTEEASRKLLIRMLPVDHFIINMD